MLHSRLLTYVDEVARTGSIRKAASHLNVAASAISRQILALETELGTHARRVEATSERQERHLVRGEVGQARAPDGPAHGSDER